MADKASRGLGDLQIRFLQHPQIVVHMTRLGQLALGGIPDFIMGLRTCQLFQVIHMGPWIGGMLFRV